MKTTNPTYDSIKSAAAGEKLPFETLRLAKAAGCKAFRGSRVHAAELRQFLKEHPELARESSEIAKLRAADLRVRIEQRKFRLAQERGEFTDTRKLVEQVGPMLTSFRDLVYAKLEQEAPVAMAGMGVPEARMIGRRMAGELLTKLQGCFRNLKA